MIPQRNISLLANRLAKANSGRRIPEAVLERDYCIAWFLVGASRTKLPSLLTFKGGTALKRCHFDEYRFSEDLDFTLLAGAKLEDVFDAFKQAYAETTKASGIVFRHSRDEPEQGVNSHTFYIAYEGPLPATARPKEIKVDITLKEQLVFDLEQKPVLRAYEEFEDLPEDGFVCVYSLKEIAAEKTVALLDKARTEPRDLYDLWFLTEGNYVNLEEITHAIEEKLAFRGKTHAEVAGAKKLATKLCGQHGSPHKWQRCPTLKRPTERCSAPCDKLDWQTDLVIADSLGFLRRTYFARTQCSWGTRKITNAKQFAPCAQAKSR